MTDPNAELRERDELLDRAGPYAAQVGVDALTRRDHGFFRDG